MKGLRRITIITMAFLLAAGADLNVLAEGKAKEGTNIAWELNTRLRNNVDEDNLSGQGFQVYEVELFLDSQVNDNASVFVEFPFSHQNYSNPGNVWLDIHKAGDLAATQQTGLMIGNFAPMFGYLNYDDNQSWIYGGRTTTNTMLIRNQKVDEQVVRDRQIGVAGGLALKDYFKDAVLSNMFAQVHIFNGSGPIEFSGGSDNDKKRDVAGRVQYTLPNNLGLVGAGYWVSPGTNGATANSGGTRWGGSGKKHVRTINRSALYFRYPNVNQATLPDFSLGGKRFMVYGEYIGGTAEAEKRAGVPATLQVDTKFAGFYLEGNAKLFPTNDKLVGILRYDLWDPDTETSSNTLQSLTPAVKWEFLNNMYLTANYEWYFSSGTSKNVPVRDEDRLAIELAVWF